MPDQLVATIAIASLVMFGYMNVWFLLAVLIRRNDIADIAWGLGFIVVTCTALLHTQNFNITTILTAILIVIWGLRLSYHIASRNIRKPEDYRYKAWRDTWGSWFYVRSYLQIFMLQGLLLLFVSVPIPVIMTFATEGVSPGVAIGVIVWVFGFMFEAISDRQLRNFLNTPSNRGRIMMTGLWSYSRHPNYFGEIAQWWGIGIIALSCSYGWIGLLGPLTITYLIVKVSGIPLLEQKYADNPEYQTYKKHTPKLIPFTK